ncbi:MAG: EAL domain-containing protein [Betaproteobacteria bacterium]
MPFRHILYMLSLLMLLAFSITGHAAPSPASIRVVLDDNYPPYIFRDSDGQPQGVLKDLWSLWQQRTGVKVDFLPMDWNKAQTTILNGQAEVIDTIFETEARQNVYDFSRPYATIEVPIFFHKSIAGITNADSLKGFTIGVKDGDACIEYLSAHGISDFKRYPNYETQVKAAVQQEIRLLCIDKPPAFFFFNRERAIDDFRHSPPLYVGEFHWAVSKGRDDLKQLIEEGFSRISAKERAAIETRWLGEKLSTGLSPAMTRYGSYLVVSVLLLMTILFIWNWALRRRVVIKTRELSATLLSLSEKIADQKHTEAKLLESKTLLQTLIRAVPDLLWMKDAEGVFLFCNQRFERYYGAPEKDIVGKTNFDFLDSELAEARMKHDRLAMERGSPCVNEEWGTYADDGHQELLEVTKTPIFDANRRLLGVLGIAHDITERKEHEKKLEHIAHYDVLTTLPNRVLLADRLQQAMVQAQRRGQLLAVGYLDLDGFKAINDRHGHQVGDKLLVILAERMKQSLRDSDTLARLGGDEFVAVMSDLDDIAACVPMLSRLLDAAAQSLVIDGMALQVSASLGVTFFPQSEEVDADQLLRQADQAMYQAKLLGKNRYHLFDAEQDRSVRGHHESLEHIRHALSANEFVLYYQPKVNMRTGEIIGAEALIRWQHPVRGLLAPGLFLPVVENHPLAVDIGQWVIDTALTQMERWKTDGLQIAVSVNVSARQLLQSDFVKCLQELLILHPSIRPGDFEIEVLETSALEDLARVSEIIESCREIGVLFSLDDFGTGYSSLTYLKRLSVNQLKIDQSFVRDMLDDPDDLSILGGVLSMATAFRREVIAEGVETVEHGAMLLQLGCELAQGYGIAHPMPAEDFPHWASTWRPDAAWSNHLPVSRDDLPMLFATVEHRAWVAAIEAFLHGERENLPLMHHQCRFSAWLEAEGQTYPSEPASFQAVKDVHQSLHALARDLCELHVQDQSRAALARLDELHGLRDALIEQLKGILGSKREHQ